MRYCIGDVHGCIKTLKKLINQIRNITMYPELFFVGDLIDRGPNSKAVLDLIMDLKKGGLKIQSVRGNHEEMMLYSYKNNYKVTSTNWINNGAKNTINSFNPYADLNLMIKDLIPIKYYNFIESLPYYIELSDYIIVHAGFNFNSRNPFTDFKSMLWSREEYTDFEFTKGKKIIHGHSPIPIEQLQFKIANKKIEILNIDTGCVYSKLKKLGELTAINLDKLELINIKNIDI